MKRLRSKAICHSFIINSFNKWLERARDYTDVEDMVLHKIDRLPALTQLAA